MSKLTLKNRVLPKDTLKRIRRKKLGLSEKTGQILIQIIFWSGYVLALHGSVEQAIFFSTTNEGSALWSSWFGPPILHHYLIGFILIAIGWIIFSWSKK